MERRHLDKGKKVDRRQRSSRSDSDSDSDLDVVRTARDGQRRSSSRPEVREKSTGQSSSGPGYLDVIKEESTGQSFHASPDLEQAQIREALSKAYDTQNLLSPTREEPTVASSGEYYSSRQYGTTYDTTGQDPYRASVFGDMGNPQYAWIPKFHDIQEDPAAASASTGGEVYNEPSYVEPSYSSVFTGGHEAEVPVESRDATLSEPYSNMEIYNRFSYIADPYSTASYASASDNITYSNPGEQQEGQPSHQESKRLGTYKELNALVQRNIDEKRAPGIFDRRRPADKPGHVIITYAGRDYEMTDRQDTALASKMNAHRKEERFSVDGYMTTEDYTKMGW